MIRYLEKRKIETQKSYLKEIHYKMNHKNYFGICFKNNSNGYEIRNPYFKGCFGKKDVSIIKNESNKLLIFEGFIDYLSYLTLNNSNEEKSVDYIILNSVSLISKVEKVINNYNSIKTYFDNDLAGENAFKYLNSINSKVEDCRNLYANHKDINEFIVNN